MINITKKENLLFVVSPYNEAFISFARAVNAKWEKDEKAWVFNLENETLKEKLDRKLYEIYKYTEDKTDRALKLKAKCEDISQGGRSKFLAIGNYVLVERYNRDSAVTYVDSSAYISKGEFHLTGGSANYPSVTFTDGAEITFEISEKYFNSLNEEEKTKFTIISKEEIDRKNLLEEKSRLLKKLEEINKLLEA